MKHRSKIYAQKGVDPASRDHLAKRLANGIDGKPHGKCWPWKRITNSEGYGQLRIKGKMVYAHRLAFEISKGPIPDGLHVMHECDNPACINPDHLTAGTRSKNMADCHARGRSKMPDPSKPGEKNAAAKLKESEVREIRCLLLAGRTQRVIALRFGVSQSQISHIKLGKAWNLKA